MPRHGCTRAPQAEREAGLKLVVMSATLDAAAFARFFHNAKTVYLQVFAPAEGLLLLLPASPICAHAGVAHPQGRQYPVDTLYLPAATDSYLDTALRTVLQIHAHEPRGDILTFLTGQDEIQALERLIPERSAAGVLCAAPTPALRCHTRLWYLMYPRQALRCRSGHIQGMDASEMLVVPIYAALSPEQQARVFEPTPAGKRKVRLPSGILRCSC